MADPNMETAAAAGSLGGSTTSSTSTVADSETQISDFGAAP
jgi:hypothetical protein